MVKRSKGVKSAVKRAGNGSTLPGASRVSDGSDLGGTGMASAHPPVKNPTLLGISILLFGLWFAFLLVTALFG